MSVQRFGPTSRYATTPTAEYTTADGEKVPYLQRRFVPPSSAFETLEEHRVQQGERLDLIAAQRLGDPLMFWQICDANDAVDPFELVEPVGRRLRITLPAGVSGVHGA